MTGSVSRSAKLGFTFFIVLFFPLVLSAQKKTTPRVKWKKTFQFEDNKSYIVERLWYDTLGREIRKDTYTRGDAAPYASVFNSYDKDNETRSSYSWRGKDSILTMKIVERKKGPRRISTEYNEQLHTRGPMHSTVLYTYVKRGKDSITYERYKLYNGDTVLHVYTIRDHKLVLHEAWSKGGMSIQNKYDYSPSGNKIRQISWSRVMGNTTTEVFTYDGSTLVTSTVDKVGDGSKTAIYYTYDEYGNEIREESNVTGDGRRTGNLTEVTDTEYTYKDGLMTKKVSHYKPSFGSSNTLMTVYIYDFY